MGKKPVAFLHRINRPGFQTFKSRQDGRYLITSTPNRRSKPFGQCRYTGGALGPALDQALDQASAYLGFKLIFDWENTDPEEQPIPLYQPQGE